MSKEPDITGENRDEQGRFAPGSSGNPQGRPKGSISVTEAIRRELETIPKNQQKTYLELLVKKIMKKALKDGDQHMIKAIWNYIDGLPKESMEISGEPQLPFKIIIEKGGEGTDKKL